MKITIETRTLPAQWASALINGDFSGCEGLDVKDIKQWLRDNAGLRCVGCADETEHTRHLDAPGNLITECLEFQFHAIGE